MIITYFGNGCFKLQSGEVSLLVDPENARMKGDVVMKTITPASVASVAPREVSFPGEYEINNMEIRGWPVAEEAREKFLKTVYLVKWEDISFAFMGHISKPVEPELLENIAGADVLFLPVDGEQFLSVQDAGKFVKQVEPHVVMIGFSKNPKDLVKVFGQKAEPMEKFVFKKKDIALERERIIILEKNG